MPLRTITIEGRAFRWIADWIDIEGRRTIRLRVWGGTKTSQALQAHLVATFREFRAAVERGEILRRTAVVDDTYIRPRDVRAAIEYALAHGWDPRASGQPFRLTAADASPSDDLAFVDIQ